MTSISFSKYAFAFTVVVLNFRSVWGEGPGVDSAPEKQTHSIVGCMTTACHGSNVPKAETWQRAGKIWFDQDPHARAFTSLLTEASVRIVSRLANEELKSSSQDYRDILNSKCVSCHANEKASEAQRVLGADCQVCHGNSDAWGSHHYSIEWKALGKHRFNNTKMFNVESMVSRAQICASCHIGELDRTSGLNVGKDREVDHQIMAAGHPPMHFDFESYLRRYPVHWDTKDEPIGTGSATGFERWRTGKITVAITKLRLLVSRAERTASKGDTPADWPELSEYNCSSCHHALDSSSSRKAFRANSIAEWDEWCISQLDCAVRDQSLTALNLQILALKRDVEQLVPKPKDVALSATSLRRWLENELLHVASPDENSVNTILSKLNARLDSIETIRNWESATQWYIASRVLCEGVGIEGLREPVPFVVQDPFLGYEKTWKPSASKDFDTPRVFHLRMLKNYSNDLLQQLRSRP